MTECDKKLAKMAIKEIKGALTTTGFSKIIGAIDKLKPEKVTSQTMKNEIKVNIRYVEPTETDKIRERHYMRKFLEGVYDELEQKIKQSNEQGYGKKKQAAEMRSHVHESGFNDALQMQAHPAGS